MTSDPLRRFARVVLLSLLALVPATARAADEATKDAPQADAEKSDDFVRFVPDDHGGGTLQAAVVTYRNADGVAVHLVSALHVGEKSYYDGLSRTFKDYDALLYEMVKPKDAAAPAPGAKPAGGMVSMFQRFLKDVLELEFQLDAIDYSAPNFVHADLDAETFLALQEKRGESLVSLMLRSMITEMQRQQQGGGAPPVSVFELLAAMNSPDSARQYKLLLARQFNGVEAQIAGLEGGEGTVILTERNKAALRVLKQTLAEGKKNVGVFYGAGHMQGIEAGLVDEMGFRKVGTEWRVAWDMTASADADGDAPRQPRPKPRRQTTPQPEPQDVGADD